jgi:hypothetical protein
MSESSSWSGAPPCTGDVSAASEESNSRSGRGSGPRDEPVATVGVKSAGHKAVTSRQGVRTGVQPVSVEPFVRDKRMRLDLQEFGDDPGQSEQTEAASKDVGRRSSEVRRHETREEPGKISGRVVTRHNGSSLDADIDLIKSIVTHYFHQRENSSCLRKRRRIKVDFRYRDVKQPERCGFTR